MTLSAAAAAWLLGAAACTEHHVKIDPIKVEPIEVNVNVRVDRELDEFFDFEEELQARPNDTKQEGTNR